MTAAMGVGAVGGGLLVAARGRTGLAAALARSRGVRRRAAPRGAGADPAARARSRSCSSAGRASRSWRPATRTLQLAAAPEMRGRVMSLWFVAFQGSTPIGGPLLGWAMGWAGARVGLGAGGVAALARRAPRGSSRRRTLDSRRCEPQPSATARSSSPSIPIPTPGRGRGPRPRPCRGSERRRHASRCAARIRRRRACRPTSRAWSWPARSRRSARARGASRRATASWGSSAAAGQAELATVHERQLMPVPRGPGLGGGGRRARGLHDRPRRALHPGRPRRRRAAARARRGRAASGRPACSSAAPPGALVTATVRNPDHRGRGGRARRPSTSSTPEGFEEHGPFDVVLELVGAPNLAGNLKALATGGRVVVIGIGAGAKAELDLARAHDLPRAHHGLHAPSPPAGGEGHDRAAPRAQRPAAASTPAPCACPIAETFPLERAAEAYDRFRAGGKLGKIVLTYVGVLELDGLTRRYGDVVALDGLTFSVRRARSSGSWAPTGPARRPRCASCSASCRRTRARSGGRAGRSTRPCAPGSATCRRSAGCTRRCASSEQLAYFARLHGAEPDTAPRAPRPLDGAGRRREPRRGPRRAALARQPAARAARHGARPRPDRARPRRAVQRPGPVGVDVMSEVLVDRAREAGVPVLFSSHQLELVERLCDAVAIIKDGGLVASGTVAELRVARRAQGLWRVEVQGAAPGWAAAVRAPTCAARTAYVTLVAHRRRAAPAGRRARRRARRALRAGRRRRWPSCSVRR